MTGRQQAYFAVRGCAVALFVVAATVLPRGPLAALAAMVAGGVGILTCIGVNAGGPGERAGAHVQAVRYEKIRPPQGDWPPYEEDQIVEGELVRPPDQPSR